MRAMIKETKGQKAVLKLVKPNSFPTEEVEKPSSWQRCYENYSDSSEALKWANDLNAIVKTVEYDDDSIEVTLKFENKEDFDHFTIYFDVVLFGYNYHN